MSDSYQEHPNHYDADGEDLWDRILPLFGVEALYHHHIINAIEYATRARNKNGGEDLGKAITNLRRANGLLTHVGLD